MLQIALTQQKLKHVVKFSMKSLDVLQITLR